jgi:hypothetical protein
MARASGRCSGGVKSSSSWIRTSARHVLASRSTRRSAPGRNSQHRRRAGGRRLSTGEGIVVSHLRFPEGSSQVYFNALSYQDTYVRPSTIRSSFGSATTRSSSSTPLRPTGATIDHRGLLADEQLARAMQHQALWCSRVLVATNRMFGLVTASQMASASVASFLCRLTYGFT